ncbi:hypothetical protein SAMN05444722_0420 [Rhodovulum sp. ES.010]|uniref:hypothetical protein n=1 Tax=Rhodovulum sp. ES.010 TaxID=1882821 RepID=UPI000927F77B|nr:hypothetical protein [Rhodovulum sp. ES.010]SIO10127.1 hypothetical protein SAMN05444722_0420 [Rhodovulum sp. ES.010]
MPKASREARAAAMVARMPHVPPAIAARMQNAFIEADFPQRGVPTAMQRFFRNLHETGTAFEEVRAEHFAAVTSTRTGFRTLVWGLRSFAPEVPLAAAAPVRQDWDRWLNATYNAKPRRPRSSTRIGLAPEEWPPAWRAALPKLDQVVRVGDQRFRPMRPKSRDNAVQAVGMLWAARDWAAGRGIALEPELTPDLVEVFARFLLDARREGRGARGPISWRSARDYLDRVRWFARRAELLDAASAEVMAEILGALCDAAEDEEPRKRRAVRAFRKRFTIADVMHTAIRLSTEADALPGCSAEAIGLRRDAMILALLVNTADRQGDLSTHRIGIEIGRTADGLWELDFAQGKTRRRKSTGALWPITSALIDHHLLGDRPNMCLPGLVADLEGANLVALDAAPMGLYYPSRVLQRHFGVSGHLVRTLVTDAVRVHRPDAAWAAQFLLGHSNRQMQESYRTDFRELAVLRDYHRALAALTADTPRRPRAGG